MRVGTTAAVLTVTAELGIGIYPKGIKIGDREMKDLEKTRITRDPGRRAELADPPDYHEPGSRIA
jgi:hypothetical protein